MVTFYVSQKYFFLRLALFSLLLISDFVSMGQNSASKNKKKNSFVAYPFAYYAPETRGGIGAAGAVNFRMSSNDTITPVSQISMGISTTQNKQGMLSIPFALYFKERKHTLTGEFSYYDFSYNFYGIGAGNISGEKTRYTVSFPLFRLNYLYKIAPHFYGGFRWWYEHYGISSFGENAELTKDVPGASGSRTSGPGVVALYDTRDNVYYSKKGVYLELVYHNQASMWGSNFFYDRYRFDFRHFLPLNNQWTIANNIFGDFIKGDVPFNQMPGIGAGRRGRGFYEGRFRDKNILLYQGEFRGTLDQRWGAVLFWNYALLSSHIQHFSFKNDHASIGFGARYAFDKSNRTNLRLDLAFPLSVSEYVYSPANAMKVYFTINEAF